MMSVTALLFKEPMMKALYRVSDGWIFNAPFSEEKASADEKLVIKSGVCATIEADLTDAEFKKHKVVDGGLVLLPVIDDEVIS